MQGSHSGGHCGARGKTMEAAAGRGEDGFQGLAETEPAGPGEEGGRRGGAGEGSRVPGLAMTTTEQ